MVNISQESQDRISRALQDGIVDAAIVSEEEGVPPGDFIVMLVAMVATVIDTCVEDKSKGPIALRDASNIIALVAENLRVERGLPSFES